MNPALGWSDLEGARRRSSLPVLVKGLLTAEDAELAVEHGAAGVVVSNHGGRQLDRAWPRRRPARWSTRSTGAPRCWSTAASAVASTCGRAGPRRRRGAGRAACSLGLAAGGAEGAGRVMGLLRDELELALALCGCPRRPSSTPRPRAESTGNVRLFGECPFSAASRWPSEYPETNR